MDFQFDETADGQQVKILNVTNEFTRETLATNAARRITAAGTMAVLDCPKLLLNQAQLIQVTAFGQKESSQQNSKCFQQYSVIQ